RMAEREGLGAEQHHPAHGGLGHFGSDPGRVTADQVSLKASDFDGGDADLRERAEAGVHAINTRCAVTGGGNALDRSTRMLDALECGGIERDRSPTARDVFEIRRRK